MQGFSVMRVIVCDSDRTWAEEVCKRIAATCKANQVPLDLSSYQTIESLLFNIEEDIEDIDLVLLEVEYPDGSDGIDAATKLRAWGYGQEIVFQTRNKTKVFRSFDANPYHYVVKGETAEGKLEEIILRIAGKRSAKKKDMISLSCAGERRNVAISDIRFFEVDHRIIRLHYGTQGEVFEFYSTIGKLENALLGRGIMRVHRAYLVNLNYVIKTMGAEITMDTGDEIPLGRTYAKEFKEAMQTNYTGGQVLTTPREAE